MKLVSGSKRFLGNEIATINFHELKTRTAPRAENASVERYDEVWRQVTRRGRFVTRVAPHERMRV